jgi:hypothetical protein
MRRGSASEREWSGGEWATGGGFQRGRRERCLGTALCTDSREQEENVGGEMARSLSARVQRVSERKVAWRCRCGAPRGWAGVAS